MQAIPANAVWPTSNSDQYGRYDQTDGTGSNGGFAQGIANFNHVPGGANVLYMDGHVEFVRYPEGYPVTAWVACEQNESRFGGGNTKGL